MAKHLTITGKVQGVGYRASFAALADALHLSGWVRNRHDGSVEAMVDGEEAAVRQIIDWSHRGPPSAHVDGVVVADVDDSLKHGRFEMRPSA